MHTPGLNALAETINQIATDHGFWPEEGRNFGEMVALMHSELSEALEEHRDGNPALWWRHQGACPLLTGFALDDQRSVGPDDPRCKCKPKPEGVAVELADCIIRALDTMYSLRVDIDKVVQSKVFYNATRPHKHGKDY